jgi:hypothetical protein
LDGSALRVSHEIQNRRSGGASRWKSESRWVTGLIGGLRARSADLDAEAASPTVTTE